MDRKRALKSAGIIVRDGIKRRMRSRQIKPVGRKSGGTTLVESGRLVRSINHEVRDSEVRIGTNVKYAQIHNEGGIIRPKTAKFLAIPLTPAARIAKPRDFDNTFIAKGIIFQKQDGGKPIALYVLKKSVTMPKRQFLTVSPDDEQRITTVLREFGISLIEGDNR